MNTLSDRYVSTRGQSPETDFADALLRGIAPDGGLYMPRPWPSLSPDVWTGAADYKTIALQAMSPFVGDALPAGALGRALDRLTAGFDHRLVTPLVELEPGLFVLELFHGPTAAFKDLAMQLVAALTDEALAASGERLTILTATSGDTGAAAVRALLPLTRPELKATEASALSSYLAAVTAAPAATGGQATGGQAGQPRPAA